MKPIWIVDDDQSIRFVLEKALLREDLPTRSFTNTREVLAALEQADDDEQQGPQVLVSDIRMPGGSGLDLLDKIKAKHPGLPVIIMTAFSDLDSAVSAFQGGAFEYLPKPFDLPRAVELIRRAVDESQREEVAEERMVAAPEMLGQAPAMQDVFRAIGRLSQSNVTVLITGESGSGKELVARALHKHSPRTNGPFVAINTAAIPKDLLESELFGHERGAFTGAQTMRRGRFEQAEGGTLFLDEIGDMPFDLQTRLLRVLSDGHFYRVGGHNSVKANVRVIAATHQDLEQRVKIGEGRAVDQIGGAGAMLGQGIDDSDQLDTRQAGQHAAMIAAHDPGANDANAKRTIGIGFGSLRTHRNNNLAFAEHGRRPGLLTRSNRRCDSPPDWFKHFLIQ